MNKKKGLLTVLYRKLFWKVLFPLSKWIYTFLPVDNRKVLFDNFSGKGFGDNLQCIAEELHTRGIDVKMIWLVDNISKYSFPSYIQPVKIESFRAMYERATSKIWIDNVRNLYPLKKKKSQVYLQTWHGPGSGKKIEGDAEDKLDKKYCDVAKRAGHETDAIISNSQTMDKVYRRAFWLNKNTEILKIGLPKYDFLFQNAHNHKMIAEIKSKYRINPTSKIVLYAPTFRDDYSTDGYLCDEFERILDAFRNLTNKNVKIIVRMHPNAISHSTNYDYSNNILDGSEISSFQELSLISDILITDYSSTSYDFLLLHKPVFICTKDIAKYEKNRGLTPEYYELPFIFTRTVDDLVSQIVNFDIDEYENTVADYLKNNPTYDNGEASAKAVDWIIEKMKSKEIDHRFNRK